MTDEVLEKAVSLMELGHDMLPEIARKVAEFEVLLRRIDKRVDDIARVVLPAPAPEPIPEPEPLPGVDYEPLKTNWLADYDPAVGKAAWTSLTLFAKPTGVERHEIVNRVVDAGGNCIVLYAVNGGDFAHTQNREFYYTPDKRGDILSWMRHFDALNLESIWMMMNDDAPHPALPWHDLDAIKAYWDRLITDVLEPMTVKHIVLGLEALEYWSVDECRELGRWLKARCPWARIGHHTLPGDTRLCGEDWVDDIYFQGPFWRLPEAYVGDYLALERDYPTKRVIMAEYSMQGDTIEAARIGNALLAAGCPGVLNGFGSPAKEGVIPHAVETQWKATPVKSLTMPSVVTSLGPVSNPFASGWRETITLRGIDVFDGLIRFPFAKHGAWETITHPDGSTSIGHLWVIQIIDGKAYATTIDWLRNSGQQSKRFPGVMQGNHLSAPMSLKAGETYGFMVTTVARNNKRTTDERSNIVWVRLEDK